MKYLMLLPLLSLISCGSTMVQSGANRSAYAPANYQEKGIVKYLANGADFIIASRREDAFKQMYMACNGNYKITREYSNDTNHNSYQNNLGGFGVMSNQYVNIEYECNSAVETAKTEKVESRSAASIPVNNGPFVPKPGQIISNCKTSKDCKDGETCKMVYSPSEEYGSCGKHGLWGRMFYK